MAKWQGRLPYPYQEVEYIESTGTQYINTGLTGLQNDVEVSFAMTTDLISDQVLFGLKMSTNNYGFGVNSNQYQFCRDKENWTKVSASIGTTKHKVQFSGNNVLVDDVVIGTISSYSTITNPITLFNWTDTTYLKGKLYEARFGNSRHFIPCYDLTDITKHTAGLYDIVNNQFYGNDGTGYFIVGEDVYNGGRITNMQTLKSVAGWKNASGSPLVKMTRVDNGKYIEFEQPGEVNYE